MIKVHNLKKNYTVNDKQISILNITNLSIEKGDQLAITGPSGCGKSTFLHIIGGVVKASEGEVVMNNTEITSLSQSSKDKFRQTNIGYVFQDFHLIPSLTAEENIKLVLTGKSRKEQKSLIDEWFNKVGLKDRKKHHPAQLSRGQQQRIAIIRALIHKPNVVLADEPTGSLDFETAQMVMNLLIDLCEKENQTLVCVTHDRGLAARFPRHIEMESINGTMKSEVKIG